MAFTCRTRPLVARAADRATRWHPAGWEKRGPAPGARVSPSLVVPSRRVTYGLGAEADCEPPHREAGNVVPADPGRLVRRISHADPTRCGGVSHPEELGFACGLVPFQSSMFSHYCAAV